VVQPYLPDLQQVYPHLVEHQGQVARQVLLADVVVVLVGIYHQEAQEPLEAMVALEVPRNL